MGIQNISDQTAPTGREAVDVALATQVRDDAQDALQDALDAHRALKHAEAELLGARVRYQAACSKLLPFRRIAQQDAA